jgi:protein CpxP
MRKLILSLTVALLIGSTVCMAQNRQKGKADREKRIEKMVTDLGLNEKQAEEMKPAKNKSDEKPSREEMQKKKKEVDAKIKSILTEEQYKKYQDMRKKDNAKKKKKAK